MHRVSGFTLVELMIVIALVAIIAAFALPQYGRMVDNSRVVSTTNAVVGLLGFARSEAVRRGQLVRISPVKGSDWNSGLVAWVDSNRDGQISAGEALRQIEAAQGKLNLTGNNIAFRGTGMAVDAASTSAGVSATYSVCSGKAQGREIKVSTGGRTSVREKQCS